MGGRLNVCGRSEVSWRGGFGFWLAANMFPAKSTKGLYSVSCVLRHFLTEKYQN